jgi:hypothetical protein
MVFSALISKFAIFISFSFSLRLNKIQFRMKSMRNINLISFKIMSKVEWNLENQFKNKTINYFISKLNSEKSLSFRTSSRHFRLCLEQMVFSCNCLQFKKLIRMQQNFFSLTFKRKVLRNQKKKLANTKCYLYRFSELFWNRREKFDSSVTNFRSNI